MVRLVSVQADPDVNTTKSPENYVTVSCSMGFLEDESNSLRLRRVWAKLPTWCIVHRPPDTNSVMINSLLFAVRKSILGSNIKDDFSDLFQGRIPNVTVGTSRFPNYGNQCHIKIGFRSLGFFSEISQSFVPEPEECDEYSPVVSMINKTDFCEGYDTQFHFVLTFSTPYTDTPLHDANSHHLPLSRSPSLESLRLYETEHLQDRGSIVRERSIGRPSHGQLEGVGIKVEEEEHPRDGRALSPLNVESPEKSQSNIGFGQAHPSLSTVTLINEFNLTPGMSLKDACEMIGCKSAFEAACCATGRNSYALFSTLVANCKNATALLVKLGLKNSADDFNLKLTKLFRGGLELTVERALKQLKWNPKTYMQKARGIQWAEEAAGKKWIGPEGQVLNDKGVDLHKVWQEIRIKFGPDSRKVTATDGSASNGPSSSGREFLLMKYLYAPFPKQIDVYIQ